MWYVQSFSHLGHHSAVCIAVHPTTTNQIALQTTAAQKANLSKLSPTGQTARHRLSTEELMLFNYSCSVLTSTYS